MFAFDRIVVPTDFSECSTRALLAAAAFASRFDSDLLLLHVTSRPGSKAYERDDLLEKEVENLETTERALREAYNQAAARVTEETGLPPLRAEAVTFRVTGGDPADEIVRVAEEARADLVVLGTHGRTRLKDYFLGSTAERVVKNANCAVLAIKPEGYPFLRD